MAYCRMILGVFLVMDYRLPASQNVELSCTCVLLADGTEKVSWSVAFYMVLEVVESESLLTVAYFSQASATCGHAKNADFAISKI